MGLTASTGVAASGGISIGVAEDASKYADDGGARVHGDLRDLGMTVNRWTLRFTGDPSAIGEAAFLDRAVPVASSAGIRVVLSLLPASAQAPDPDTFCRWAEHVVRRYPTIRDVVVGNEVNATRFWAPQKTDADPDAGPRSYLAVLSACYDRLKAVDPGIVVIGMGLAPRAVDKNSTKPLDFLRAVGRLYRESGRTTPIMDRLAIHPYPNPNASPPPSPDRARYDDPAFFGLAQLDRVKQAVHDAFDGTPQPTTLGGLRLTIDEFGYQTETTGGIDDAARAEYTGAEVSPVVSDSAQAQYLADAVSLAACDPTVAELLLFHLLDEQQRQADANAGGWQSGLERPSGARKPAYEAVKAAIGRGCTRSPVVWVPDGQTEDTEEAAPRSASADPLTEALEKAYRAFQGLPALATDGAAADLLSVPEAGAALEAAARRIADSFQTDYDRDVRLPSVFWSLPGTFRTATAWKAVTFVIPPQCEIRVGSDHMTCFIVDRKDVDLWLADVWPRSWRDSLEVEICWLGMRSAVCKRRDVQSRSAAPKRSRLVVKVAATGSGRAKRGGRLAGTMRVVRRGPGLYVTVIAVGDRTDASKVGLVRLRPFLVKPTATRLARRTAQPSSPPAQR